MQWFRLHNKLLNDPIVQGLTSDQFKVYINVLCYTSSLDKGGYIGTLHETSFALRETIEHVTSCFIAFHTLGLVVTSGTDSETFHIPQWKKKQYESDSSSDRVRKHREKVKRSKTVTETAPDTDTDTEQIQTKTLDQSALDREFENVWADYGKKGNRKTSKTRYLKLSAKKKLLMAAHFPNYVLSTPDKQYRKGMEVYITKEAWNDEVINHGQQNQSGRYPTKNKLTAVERIRARRAEAEADNQGGVGFLGDDGDTISQHVAPRGGGGADGDVGEIVDGAFTRTD